MGSSGVKFIKRDRGGKILSMESGGVKFYQMEFDGVKLYQNFWWPLLTRKIQIIFY